MMVDGVTGADINAMPVKELKQALTAFGVSHSTFREKTELQKALKDAVLRAKMDGIMEQAVAEAVEETCIVS